jgi:hypothetical protein
MALFLGCHQAFGLQAGQVVAYGNGINPHGISQVTDGRMRVA